MGTALDASSPPAVQERYGCDGGRTFEYRDRKRDAHATLTRNDHQDAAVAGRTDHRGLRRVASRVGKHQPPRRCVERVGRHRRALVEVTDEAALAAWDEMAARHQAEVHAIAAGGRS